MIPVEREICVMYQNPQMMRIFAECCREGIHAFNDFILRETKKQYENRCYKGSFIKSVNKILQRSSIQMGDFLRDGTEIVSVSLRLAVSQIVAEAGSVIVCKVQEVTQASSNTMKLVVCKGIGEFEMVRVYLTIENTQTDNYQFSTGQIIPVIAQEALYREDAIHIIAHPYIPMSGSLIYQLDGIKLDPAYTQALLQKIRLTRVKLNTMPQQTIQSLLQLLCRADDYSPKGVNVEDYDFQKSTILELGGLSLFTGVITESKVDPADPRVVRVKTEQALVSILHKIQAFTKVVEQLMDTLGGDHQKSLGQLKQYILTSLKDTQIQQ